MMTAPLDKQHHFEMCINGNCSACPSYPKDSGEALFCVRGPSRHPMERRGCNCPECEFWSDCGMSQMYYCFKADSD